jgi:hypothetical protein
MDAKIIDPNTLKIVPIPPAPATQALSSTTFHAPPLDGSLTIAEMWDWHAEHSPEHPVFQYSDDNGNVTTIKWPEAARAMHRGGRFMQSFAAAHPVSSSRKPIVSILASSGESYLGKIIQSR